MKYVMLLCGCCFIFTVTAHVCVCCVFELEQTVDMDTHNNDSSNIHILTY